MKITELYAVIDDSPGSGIVGVMLKGEWFPLVFTDLTQYKRWLAQNVAKQTGRQLTLAKFGGREDVEVILP